MPEPGPERATMQRLNSLDQLTPWCVRGVAMVLGTLDGVHRGHQMLIHKAVRHAREHGLRSLVFTFADHPLSLLAPPYAPLMLSTAGEKAALLERLGVDLCLTLDFSHEFAAIPADGFLENILAGHCRMRYLACGRDFRFGREGAGDVALLDRHAGRLGYRVEVCEAMLEGAEAIRSTRVRQALVQGRLEEANRLLGRPYTLPARVVAGDRRGRTLGFPTANLEPPARRLAPGDGVYAVRVAAEGHAWAAMMNIGHRPTFDAPRTLEAHLFDFAGDLYGQDVTVTFAARIRDTRRFDSADALAEQLKEDEAACRTLLQSP
jgi:riboflavin kinase/FMN adenylyltransferase